MNKEITIHNYEAWLVDLIEGKLPPGDRALLEDFFTQHPHLKEDYYEALELTDDLPELDQSSGTSGFSGEHLKITPVGKVNQSNYGDYLVAEVEGTLSASEAAELNRFIELNPVITKEQQLYRATRMVADHSIRFPGKDKLHKPRIISINRKLVARLAVAASILAVLFLGIENFFFTPETGISEKQVAENKATGANEKPGPGDSAITSERKDVVRLPSIGHVMQLAETRSPERSLAYMRDKGGRDAVFGRAEEKVALMRTRGIGTLTGISQRPQLAMLHTPHPVPGDNGQLLALGDFITNKTKQKLKAQQDDGLLHDVLNSMNMAVAKFTNSKVTVKTDQQQSNRIEVVAINTPFFEVKRN